MLMTRIAAVFVAICMVLVAGSIGAVLFLTFGFRLWEAATAALALLIVFGFTNMVATRLRDRSVVGDHIADISRSAADIARQVAAMDRRLVAIESKVAAAVNKTRAITDPLAIELDELGTLVKQLAESVAAQEAAAERDRSSAAAASTRAASPPAESGPSQEADQSKPALAASLGSRPSEEIVAAVHEAVEANRVDLYLQPIVTLPQRKVRYYEAMSRLRTDTGEVVPAGEFIPYAESAGLMPKIDNLLVFRCVQIVRRLLLKNREIGLFCNLSSSTLTDSIIFPQLLEFLEANRAIAPSLMLEFTQSALRAMGPIEQEALAALAERGFRFSLDNVADLRIEPRELADRHFKYIKIPGSLLLNRAGSAVSSDIHPADLSNLLARSGIDLIAEKIEGDSMVVDLLDYDVRFGQGFLFSPPRPVRAEALQGVGERDVVVRDAVEEPAKAAPEISVGDAPKAATDAKPRSGLAQLATSVFERS
jgi:cyclic-di-GMP phosphodiesterase TipF (flagellum assembly factor)